MTSPCGPCTGDQWFFHQCLSPLVKVKDYAEPWGCCTGWLSAKRAEQTIPEGSWCVLC